MITVPIFEYRDEVIKAQAIRLGAEMVISPPKTKHKKLFTHTIVKDGNKLRLICGFFGFNDDGFLMVTTPNKKKFRRFLINISRANYTEKPTVIKGRNYEHN